MIKVEFNLTTQNPDNSTKTSIVHRELDSVPRVGETVIFLDKPFVVMAVDWRIQAKPLTVAIEGFFKDDTGAGE